MVPGRRRALLLPPAGPCRYGVLDRTVDYGDADGDGSDGQDALGQDPVVTHQSPSGGEGQQQPGGDGGDGPRGHDLVHDPVHNEVVGVGKTGSNGVGGGDPTKRLTTAPSQMLTITGRRGGLALLGRQ